MKNRCWHWFLGHSKHLHMVQSVTGTFCAHFVISSRRCIERFVSAAQPFSQARPLSKPVCNQAQGCVLAPPGQFVIRPKAVYWHHWSQSVIRTKAVYWTPCGTKVCCQARSVNSDIFWLACNGGQCCSLAPFVHYQGLWPAFITGPKAVYCQSLLQLGSVVRPILDTYLAHFVLVSYLDPLYIMLYFFFFWDVGH